MDGVSSPLKKLLCRRGRAIVTEDKARDRAESGDSERKRNAVIRSLEPAAARMDFFNGLLCLLATKFNQIERKIKVQ